MPDYPLLLRASDIAAMEPEHKTHFLNPRAVRTQRSLGDATGLGHIGVHLVEIEPGFEATEYHMHHEEEECVFVLSGKGTAVINDVEYDVGPGDFIGLPRATAAHNIMNTGEETLILLVMGERLAFDVADNPHQGKRLYRHRGEWRMVALDQTTPIRGGLPPRRD
ncbi:MAG: cupin domain-containing protein [Gammaproteobacteria bacterium]|nr:MAG: cupin domain-containing protein [Gammaproteobacteria bacterium]